MKTQEEKNLEYALIQRIRTIAKRLESRTKGVTITKFDASQELLQIADDLDIYFRPIIVKRG